MLPGQDSEESDTIDDDAESAALAYDRAGDLDATAGRRRRFGVGDRNMIHSARELAESIADRTIPVDVNEVYDELLNDAMNRPNRYRLSERVPTRPVDDASGQPLLVHLTTRHRP